MWRQVTYGFTAQWHMEDVKEPEGAERPDSFAQQRGPQTSMLFTAARCELNVFRKDPQWG